MEDSPPIGSWMVVDEILGGDEGRPPMGGSFDSTHRVPHSSSLYSMGDSEGVPPTNPPSPSSSSSFSEFDKCLNELEAAWAKASRTKGIVPIPLWERVKIRSREGFLSQNETSPRGGSSSNSLGGSGPLVSEFFFDKNAKVEAKQQPVSTYKSSSKSNSSKLDEGGGVSIARSHNSNIPADPLNGFADEQLNTKINIKHSPEFAELFGGDSSADENDVDSPAAVPPAGSLDFECRRISNKNKPVFPGLSNPESSGSPNSSINAKDSLASPHPFSPNLATRHGRTQTKDNGGSGCSVNSNDYSKNKNEEGGNDRPAAAAAGAATAPKQLEPPKKSVVSVKKGRNPRHLHLKSGGAPIKLTLLCTSSNLDSRRKRRENWRRSTSIYSCNSSSSSNSHLASTRTAGTTMANRGEVGAGAAGSTLLSNTTTSSSAKGPTSRSRNSILRRILPSFNSPKKVQRAAGGGRTGEGGQGTTSTTKSKSSTSTGRKSVFFFRRGASKKDIAAAAADAHSVGAGNNASSSSSSSKDTPSGASQSGPRDVEIDNGEASKEKKNNKRSRKSVSGYASVLRKVIGLHERQIRRLQKERRREQSRRRTELMKWQRWALPDLYRISDLHFHSIMMELTARLQVHFACCGVLERENQLIQLALNGGRALDAKSFAGRIKLKGKVSSSEIEKLLGQHQTVMRRRSFQQRAASTLARVHTLYEAIRRQCSRPFRSREQHRRQRLRALVSFGYSSANALKNFGGRSADDQPDSPTSSSSSASSSSMYYHAMDPTDQTEYEALMLDQRSLEGKFISRMATVYSPLSSSHPAERTPEPPGFVDTGLPGSLALRTTQDAAAANADNADGGMDHQQHMGLFSSPREADDSKEKASGRSSTTSDSGFRGTSDTSTKTTSSAVGKDHSHEYKKIRSYIVMQGLRIAYGSEEYPNCAVSCLALYADRMLVPLLRPLLKLAKKQDEIDADMRFCKFVRWARNMTTPAQFGILAKFCPEGYHNRSQSGERTGARRRRRKYGCGGSEDNDNNIFVNNSSSSSNNKNKNGKKNSRLLFEIYPKSVRVLSSIQSSRSPTDALRCLLETVTTVREEAERYALDKRKADVLPTLLSPTPEESNDTTTPEIACNQYTAHGHGDEYNDGDAKGDQRRETVDIDADMLFPIVVWVFVHADIPGIHGWLGIISSLLETSATTYGETGMALALAQAASSHIASLKPKDFTRENDTKEGILHMHRDSGPSSIVSDAIEVFRGGDDQSANGQVVEEEGIEIKFENKGEASGEGDVPSDNGEGSPMRGEDRSIATTTTAATDTATTLDCPVCGAKLRKSARICNECGTELATCLDDGGNPISHIVVDTDI